MSRFQTVYYRPGLRMVLTRLPGRECEVEVARAPAHGFGSGPSRVSLRYFPTPSSAKRFIRRAS